MTEHDDRPDDAPHGEGDRDDGGDGEPDGDVSSRATRDPWLKRVAVIVAATVGMAVLAAAGLGAAGAGGAGAAVGLLLVLALGCGVAALVALATSAVDEFRGRPVTLRRPVLGIVLLATSIVFTVMAAGAL